MALVQTTPTVIEVVYILFAGEYRPIQALLGHVRRVGHGKVFYSSDVRNISVISCLQGWQLRNRRFLLALTIRRLLNWSNDVLVYRMRSFEDRSLDASAVGSDHSFILLDKFLHLIFFKFSGSYRCLLFFFRGLSFLLLHLSKC